MTAVRVLTHKTESISAYLQARSAEVAIIRNGFIELPVDPTFLQSVFSVVQHDLKWMTDTPELRDAFPFRIVARDAYGERYTQEVGLKRRSDNEQKWWFQYTPEAYGDPSPTQEKVALFLRALRGLDAKAKEIAVSVGECFDARNRRKSTMAKYPGSMADRLRRGRCITRALRYPSIVNATSAYPHIDRCCFAIHWGSTHEGLVIVGQNGERYRIEETSFSSAGVFPGEKFAAITRGIYGLGTPHGVLRESGRMSEDRYALVSFVHPEAHEDDAAWLLAHREEIEAYEQTLRL